MPVLAKRRKRKVLFRVYQNLSDINHITHRQFNLLIVVIMFHPIIGVRFGFDTVGQTVMVSQVERHTEWEVITDTAAQCRIGTTFKFVFEHLLGLFYTWIAQRRELRVFLITRIGEIAWREVCTNPSAQ